MSLPKIKALTKVQASRLDEEECRRLVKWGVERGLLRKPMEWQTQAGSAQRVIAPHSAVEKDSINEKSKLRVVEEDKDGYTR